MTGDESYNNYVNRFKETSQTQPPQKRIALPHLKKLYQGMKNNDMEVIFEEHLNLHYLETNIPIPSEGHKPKTLPMEEESSKLLNYIDTVKNNYKSLFEEYIRKQQMQL